MQVNWHFRTMGIAATGIWPELGWAVRMGWMK